MSMHYHWRVFVYAFFAGLAFRLFLVATSPIINNGDTVLYADIARTWLEHGIYGQMIEGVPMPTYTRLPGYPALLAAVFTLFGKNHYVPVLLIQTLADL